MIANVELFKPKLMGEYIVEGSAMLEGNRGIKSLSSLQIFSKRGHTVHMQVHMGRTPFVVAANNFCWSRGTSIGMGAQFGTRFLSFSV
jgi:hypothetical protein